MGAKANSLIIIVLVLIAAGALYATRYVGQGFVGVTPLLSDNPLFATLNPIIVIIMFALLGVAVYYIRRMK